MAPAPAVLKLFSGDPQPCPPSPDLEPLNRVGVRINGHLANIDVWSPVEWARLRDKPADVLDMPNGNRVLLRFA